MKLVEDEFAVRAKKLRRVFKSRGSSSEIVALDTVDLEVNKGEIFGLLGPNGAGKTTLVKILATILLPSSGQATVLGMDVAKSTHEIRKRINLVSGGETPGYGAISVRENLWFFSQLYGLASEVANQRIEKLAHDLELTEYLSTRMHKLSTGFKQRMNLVRGFINSPDVLFLDEPTLGLDVLSALNLRRVIKSWIEDHPAKTILLTTHYMAEADVLCDRIAMINHGKILAMDTPRALRGMVARDSSNAEQSFGSREPTLEDVYIRIVGKSFEDSEKESS
ncbi:MAG: ABC transporter ATP-binding protein [Thaumarchaeota archaeon]|nr:ABC transporter ATP-binding protein [Nitrososphaerota archaeon]